MAVCVIWQDMFANKIFDLSQCSSRGSIICIGKFLLSKWCLYNGPFADEAGLQIGNDITGSDGLAESI